MKKDKFDIQKSAFDEITYKRKIAISIGVLCCISTAAYFIYKKNKSIKEKLENNV